MTVRDWIIAHIFRHKCSVMPIKVQFAEMGPGKARYGFDPKSGMELGLYLPVGGKSSTSPTTLLAQMELNRMRGDLLRLAEQLEEWAENNQREADRRHGRPAYTYHDMAIEMRNIAALIRRIAQGRQ